MIVAGVGNQVGARLRDTGVPEPQLNLRERNATVEPTAPGFAPEIVEVQVYVAQPRPALRCQCAGANLLRLGTGPDGLNHVLGLIAVRRQNRRPPCTRDGFQPSTQLVTEDVSRRRILVPIISKKKNLRRPAEERGNHSYHL